jgi:ribosome recycling factor
MADMELIETLLLESEEKMEKSINVLKDEYIQLRVGRANPRVLDKVLVDYYGEMTPINQTANISVQEGKCLVIAPWDKSLLKNVEKAILLSNLGINPTNDGNVVRLVFPDLTQERRKEIVKDVKKKAEETKVAVRNIRRETLDVLKKMKANKEVTEDEYTVWEKDVEKTTSTMVDSIDKLCAEKEKDVLTI